MCQVELMFLDMDTGNNLTLSEEDLAITVTNISFNSQLLTSNRQYSLRVSASNVAGQAVSNEVISM